MYYRSVKMSDTRKIIPLEDNTPKRDASRLEGQNEGYNEFFLGAFSKYYYYWTTKAAFMKAVSDGDAVTVMQDGTVDADLSRLSLKNAQFCIGEEDLNKAIEEVKVYCYLEYQNNLFLPEAEL